ncbi:MAG: protein phosphatase 2C domain-containing protein [Clostridiales bacterium]|nr:protein phosphatase 2C domain-containing protein [Clostridiales bacterium]
MLRKTCARRVQGASHIRSGQPCQDGYMYMEYPDGTTILAVADGHGSKSCPFSGTGARVAVSVFCSVVGKLLDNFAGHPDLLMAYLNREGEIKIAQEIDREWKRRILKIHTESRDQESAQAVCRLYGTTLLGLLLTPQFLFAFQIGDGDIVQIDAAGAAPVIEAEKFLGTQTNSLCAADAWKKAVTVLHRFEEEETSPVLYLLSTDGFSNSHVSDASFGQTCREYYDTILEYGFDAVAASLKGWLAQTSELGCGDDITVALACFCPETACAENPPSPNAFSLVT